MDGSGLASISPYARTPEDVFTDFRGRRAGIVKALTTDVEKFYELCDPKKENLCLYGLPNGTWEVTLPCEEVPPDLPEPALGINFARDVEKDWLDLVAVHSDAWLIAVAFYFATRFGFDKDARRRLYMMIGNLPTVLEEFITETAIRKQKENLYARRARLSAKRSKKSNSNGKPAKQPLPKQEEQIIKKDGGDMCGRCGGVYSDNEDFWIGCDFCEKWYHGLCVRITPAKAERIEQYRCPDCSI